MEADLRPLLNKPNKLYLEISASGLVVGLRGQGRAPRRLRNDPTNGSDIPIHAQTTVTSNILSSAVLQRTVLLTAPEASAELLWFNLSCRQYWLTSYSPWRAASGGNERGSPRPDREQEQTGALHILELSGGRSGLSLLLLTGCFGVGGSIVVSAFASASDSPARFRFSAPPVMKLSALGVSQVRWEGCG